MANVWIDGITEERKNLDSIMEEEDKGQGKGFFFSFLIYKIEKVEGWNILTRDTFGSYYTFS